MFIYSLFDDQDIFYKEIRLNLISGLEDPLISIFEPVLNEDSREKTNTKQLDLILNEVRIKKYDYFFNKSNRETFSDYMRDCIDEFSLNESHKKIKHFSFSYTEIHKKRKVFITKEQENKLYEIGENLNLKGKGQVGCFIMDRFTDLTYDDMKLLDTGNYHTSKKYPKRIVLPLEVQFYKELKNILTKYELNFVGQIIRLFLQNKIDRNDKSLSKIVKKEISNEEKKDGNKIKRTTLQLTTEQYIFYQTLKSRYNLTNTSLIYSLVKEQI